MANTIKLELELEGKDALKTIQGLNKALKGFGDNAEKNTKKADDSFKGIQVTTQSLITGLGALGAIQVGRFLADQAGEAFDAFVEFESALVGVGKTTNITGKELEDFGKEILNLTKTLPATSGELLSIAEAAGQLGVTGQENLLLFTETIAQLGRVSDLEGAEAATTLTRILNVTREGIGTIDTFASGIVALGNNFAATEGEIARVTNEVARATAQFGVSAGEAAALSATLRSFGVRAEEAGTVVGKSFRAIQQSIDEGGARLRKLSEITGIAGADLRKEFSEDALAVFRRFLQGIRELEAGGATLSTELSAVGLEGERVQKVIPTLSSNVDELSRAIKTYNEGSKDAVALTTEFGQAATTTKNQLQLLDNAIERAQVRIGEKLAGAFSKVTPLLTEFFTQLGESRTQTFARQTDDVNKLNKELEILIKKREGILADGEVGFFEADPDEIAEDIKAIQERIDSLNTAQARKEIGLLEGELQTLQGLSDADIASGIFGTPEEIQARKDFLLSQVKNAKEQQAIVNGEIVEQTKQKEKAETEAIVAERQNRKSILDELRAVEKEEELARKEEEKLAKELENEEEFQFLSEQLGRERALRELNRINNIKDEKRKNAELKKLRDKAVAEEKASIFAIRKFEDLSAREKIQLQKQTLSTIASLTQSNNKALFAVGKAASLSLAGINIAEGVTKALSAFPPPFNFAAAAAVGAAGAVQISKIASAKPPSAGNFQDGGIVGGNSFSGDRLTANVNSGELILNRRDQTSLFNAIKNNELGNQSSLSINIEAGVGGISENQVDQLIDAINDRTEFGNKNLRVS